MQTGSDIAGTYGGFDSGDQRAGWIPDSNYFVKVFKKYKNMTQTAYRNKFHK